MASDDADQERFVDVCVVPLAAKLAGTVGAVVSGGAKVVTLTELLADDTFPAASFALTLNAYVVLAVNPVT